MIIGVTCGGTGSVYKINKAYTNYVKEAGMIPVVLTPGTDAMVMATICDGLLLTGGIDLEPTFYGEDNVGSSNVDIERDDFERQLLHAFVMQKKKVFGICRGFQLIVRTLLTEIETKDLVFYQHINNHALATARSIPRNIPSHSIYANHKILYGKGGFHERMFVNSMHHQALLAEQSSSSVDYVNPYGDKLTVCAYTKFGINTQQAGQLVVEAVVASFKGCLLKGVQWHPEELKDVKLLQYFFNEENISEGEQKHSLANGS